MGWSTTQRTRGLRCCCRGHTACTSTPIAENDCRIGLSDSPATCSRTNETGNCARPSPPIAAATTASPSLNRCVAGGVIRLSIPPSLTNQTPGGPFRASTMQRWARTSARVVGSPCIRRYAGDAQMTRSCVIRWRATRSLLSFSAPKRMVRSTSSCSKSLVTSVKVRVKFSSPGHSVRGFDDEDRGMAPVMHELAQHEQGRGRLAPRGQPMHRARIAERG